MLIGVAVDCLGTVQLVEEKGRWVLTYMPFDNHSRSSFNPSGMLSRLNWKVDMIAKMGKAKLFLCKDVCSVFLMLDVDFDEASAGPPLRRGVQLWISGLYDPVRGALLRKIL
jgi:hypothetical protein